MNRDLKEVKINLGCGEDYRHGWVNVDFNKEVKADFYADIKKKYFEEDKNYPSLILKNKSVTFKFKSLYKVLVALVDTGAKLNFLSKQDDYTAFAELNQLPWPFAAGIKEDKLMRKFFKSYKKFYLLCKSENIANKLIHRYYKTLNKNIYLKFDKNCAQECDTLSMGKLTAQFFYGRSLKKSLDKSYAKLKNLKQISLNELYKNLFLKEIEINVVITRNPELAKIKKERIKLAFGVKS